jgi:Tfp pilus assembly protein FimV
LEKEEEKTEETPTPKAEMQESLQDLQKSIITKDKQIESLKSASGTFKEDITRLNANLEHAVKSYRQMVVKAHPGIPEELITGKSVEEIDTSLATAKKIVDRVKKSLEAEVPENVPVGAPTRSSNNAQNLSPREKIQYAMGGSC